MSINRRPRLIKLEMQGLTLDRHRIVTVLNKLMVSFSWFTLK